MYAVDLNCDLGESFGNYKLGMDSEVLPMISSANIACGYHASDPHVMRSTIEMAAKCGASIGAHPGFPDLMGFGRRNMAVTPQEAKDFVTYQLGALYAFCKSCNAEIQHVKPHGALYNMAGKDYALAKAICEAVYEFDPEIILLGLTGSEMIRAAKDLGLKCANEFFADRAYEEDGSLVNRRKEGAMITDEELAIERVIRVIKEKKVTAITGKDIELDIDSICVHGDGAKALEFVKRIRERLAEEGVEITNLKNIIRMKHA